LESLESIFSWAHRELRPRTPIPEINVEFFPFAGLNHTARLNEGRLTVRVSDIFADAPSDVYQALALILLSKLYRKKIDTTHQNTYRAFILRTEIQERARAVRHERSRVTSTRGSRGRHVDLEELFDRLNQRHFAGTLDKPRLSWSARKSRFVLGRYDATHHTIFVSRLFDAPSIPGYVVEYVMFHEMLHVKHQSRVRDSRIIVHTHEFKMQERSFPHYQEAKLWLKGL
jgi:predicted metal-dependent hydrolase